MKSIQSHVQHVIEQRRVGTPVFVRWIMRTPEPEPAILATMLTVAEGWLQSRPLRLYVRANEGATTLNVLFEGGQTTLLILAEEVPDKAPHTDLMLLGNRGAMYAQDLPIQEPIQAEPSRVAHIRAALRDAQVSTCAEEEAK